MSRIIKAEYMLIRLLNFKRWIVFAHIKKQVICTGSQFYTTLNTRKPSIQYLWNNKGKNLGPTIWYTAKLFSNNVNNF